MELTESTGSQYCGNEPDREIAKDDIWIQPYQVRCLGRSSLTGSPGGFGRKPRIGAVANWLGRKGLAGQVEIVVDVDCCPTGPDP